MNNTTSFPDIWQQIIADIRMYPFRPILTSHGYLVLKETKIAIKNYINGGTILDIGAGDLRYKNLIEGLNCKYISAEFCNEKVDIRCDAHNLPFKNESFDAILCSQVLEHLKNPFLAISEIERVLKIKGKLILTVPMSIYIHEAPYDFYRFTEYGIKNLLILNRLHLIEKKEICSIFIVLLELIQIMECIIIYKIICFSSLRRRALVICSIISKLCSYLDLPILKLIFPSNLLYVSVKYD